MNQFKITKCNKCYELSTRRKHIVGGCGNLKSKIVFIGEAPGYHEDKHGIPFIGKSGEKLNEYLDLCSLTRNDIYVTNIIKCRPPGNRNPWDIEILNCREYLKYELLILEPKIIVLLGSTALNSYFLNKPERLKISSFIGTEFKFNKILFIPCYHPSYVLRGTAEEKQVKDLAMRKCFKLIVKRYRELINPLHISKEL